MEVPCVTLSWIGPPTSAGTLRGDLQVLGALFDQRDRARTRRVLDPRPPEATANPTGNEAWLDLEPDDVGGEDNRAVSRQKTRRGSRLRAPSPTASDP